MITYVNGYGIKLERCTTCGKEFDEMPICILPIMVDMLFGGRNPEYLCHECARKQGWIK